MGHRRDTDGTPIGTPIGAPIGTLSGHPDVPNVPPQTPPQDMRPKMRRASLGPPSPSSDFACGAGTPRHSQSFLTSHGGAFSTGHVSLSPCTSFIASLRCFFCETAGEGGEGGDDDDRDHDDDDDDDEEKHDDSDDDDDDENDIKITSGERRMASTTSFTGRLEPLETSRHRRRPSKTSEMRGSKSQGVPVETAEGLRETPEATRRLRPATPP